MFGTDVHKVVHKMKYENTYLVEVFENAFFSTFPFSSIVSLIILAVLLEISFKKLFIRWVGMVSTKLFVIPKRL